MVSDSKINLPDEWSQFDWDELSDVVMVIGAPDVGKTTFSHYVFQKVKSQPGSTVAILDGDPGQSSLGYPTTLTLFLSEADQEILKSGSLTRRMFVGSTSPRGHMLPLIVGASRLISYAQARGAKLVIYDTSGLIASEQGGLSFKGAKIDLLKPSVIIAIQMNDELEPLLTPYRRSRRVRILDLTPSEFVTHRDKKTRQEYRAVKFKEYFENSSNYELRWDRIAVFPLPRFSLNRLIAFESEEGYLMALGIVIKIDRLKKTVLIKTPLKNTSKVNAIRIGDIDIEPETYFDRQVI